MVFSEATYQSALRWTSRTKIDYVPDAKKGNTKSAERYAVYCHAKTIGEALELGSRPEDILFDYERKFLSVRKANNGYERRKPYFDEEDLSKLNALQKFLRRTRGQGGSLKSKHMKMAQAVKLSRKMGINVKAHKTCKDTETMFTERMVADRMAETVLDAVEKANRRVTDREVLAVLRLWGFKRNETRQNVLPEGQDWVHSDTLGLIRTRTGTWIATQPTHDYPNVARVLARWLRDRRPPELGEENFPYTSMSLNSGYAAKRHRDGNNAGPSMIKAFGKFEGGQLCYWPDDDKSGAVEDLRKEDRVELDISAGLTLFDGNRAHEVEDFKGERFSVVFFSAGKYWKAPAQVQELLKDRGFELPHGDNAPEKKVAVLLPKPRGYVRCQSIDAMFGAAPKQQPPKVYQWPNTFDAKEEDAAQKLVANALRVGASMPAPVAPEKSLKAFFDQGASATASPAAAQEGSASTTPKRRPFSCRMALSGEKRRRGRPLKQKRSASSDEAADKRPRMETAPISDAQAPGNALEQERDVFNPAEAEAKGLQSDDLSLLVHAVAVAEGQPSSLIALTNYFRLILHSADNAERELTNTLELLLPRDNTPKDLLPTALLKAFFLGVTAVKRASHGTEGQGLLFLTRALQSKLGVSSRDVLCALAGACAFRGQGCTSDAATSMEDAIRLAYGQTGGSLTMFVKALLSSTGPQELVDRCHPRIGVSILPMKVESTSGIDQALADIAGEAVLVEQFHTGERVQLHKHENGSLQVFGPCQTDITAAIAQEMIAAALESLSGTTQCILDAVLQKQHMLGGVGRFQVFDCLWLNGESFVQKDLRTRREALHRAIPVAKASLLPRAAELQIVPSEEFQKDTLSAAVVQALLARAGSDGGCSGIVMKRLDGARYKTGEVSREWCVVSRLRR